MISLDENAEWRVRLDTNYIDTTNLSSGIFANTSPSISRCMEQFSD